MISREKLIALYSAIVRYRLLAAQTQDSLPKSWQLTPGLEATVAAVTADLRRDDFFAAAESKLFSAFIPRSNWRRLFDVAAFKSIHARNGHLPASALARQFASALEAAETLRTSKGDAVALLFCETRTRADLWRKPLQEASSRNLPIVLVRLARDAPRAHVTPAAFVLGVPRIAVDANDVLAVYRVASESIARARHRRGPTLIECLQGSSHAARESADPIRAMEVVLSRKGILNAPLKQKIETAIRRDLKKTLRLL